MSLDERPRGSARPTPMEHFNSLPRTSIEGALRAAPLHAVHHLLGLWIANSSNCVGRRGIPNHHRIAFHVL